MLRYTSTISRLNTLVYNVREVYNIEMTLVSEPVHSPYILSHFIGKFLHCVTDFIILYLHLEMFYYNLDCAIDI